MKIGTDINVTIPVGDTNERDKKWVKVGINMAEIDLDGSITDQLTQARSAITQSLDASSDMVYERLQELTGERPAVQRPVDKAMEDINETLGELAIIVSNLKKIIGAHLEEHETTMPQTDLTLVPFDTVETIGTAEERETIQEQPVLTLAPSVLIKGTETDDTSNYPPSETPTPAPKKRGRKPGSKNKDKVVAQKTLLKSLAEEPKPEVKHICQTCRKEFATITELVNHHITEHKNKSSIGIDIANL